MSTEDTNPPETAHLVAAVQKLAMAMRVMEIRHPRCGAVAWTREVLRNLPKPLRPTEVDLPPHPEDDQDDGRATIAALTRENRRLRGELAALGAEQPGLFEVGGA